jgi:hypothetical protein
MDISSESVLRLVQKMFTGITIRFLQTFKEVLFHKRRITFRSRDRVVGTVSRLRAGRLLPPVLLSKRFLPSAKRHDCLWSPPSLPFTGYRVSFPRVKQPGRATDHVNLVPRLRISGAIPHLPLYAFMAWTGIFFSNGSIAPWGPRPPHFSRLHDHTLFRHTTLGRTLLDEGPARRRDLYLTTHNTHKRHPCLRWDSNPQSQ